ncbi:MAG: hypothetical protein IPJ81_17980 [Chitinophagaceae bacterium]|nr:hypothetical protein [Chitinophagaceae bacterium]
MPNTQNLSEKGLKNFNTYGDDVGRVYDYPGGFQDAQIMEHDHFMFGSPDNNGVPYAAISHSTGGNLGYSIYGTNGIPNEKKTGKAGGAENIVKNIGVIFGRRI